MFFKYVYDTDRDKRNNRSDIPQDHMMSGETTQNQSGMLFDCFIY